MAEQRSDETPHRYEETMEPRNPPNSVLNKGARRAAVFSYFVPILILAVVIGVIALYWSRQASQGVRDREEIGTVGSSEGGFDPTISQRDSTRDEVEFRSDDLVPISKVSELADVNARTMRGRRVSIPDAEVDSVSGSTIWLRDGDRRFAVVAPQGASAPSQGATVSITGHIEADENGAPMIRADRIQNK